MHDSTHAKTFLMFFLEKIWHEIAALVIQSGIYMLQFPVSSKLVISMHAENIPGKRYLGPRLTAVKP